ncbi:short chain dehydrogenase [Amycolatopsis regifaucium]|nr:short chain dehydrogenase [Amycolatopsis regifaucium]
MLSFGQASTIHSGSMSTIGRAGFATIAPSNASEHGVISLTKVAALEYADKNIQVNAFAPGAVDTPMLRRAAEAFGLTCEQIERDYPIKRIVRPEELATVVMWLSSPESSAVTGTDVDASGGYLTG